MLFSVGIFVLIVGTSAHAMHDPIYLFGDDAKTLLDSLEKAKSSDFLTMGILAHNLSFSKKKAEMTERAYGYFSLLRLKGSYSDTLSVYECLLALLAIRDENILKKGGGFVGGLLGIAQSPEDAAHEAFRCLSREVRRSSNNLAFRFLRASAAEEAADLLTGLLPMANEDLIQIGFLLAHQTDEYPTHQFFFALVEAKYQYRLAKEQRSRVWTSRRLLIEANESLCRASTYAHGKWQRGEISLWNKRIEELFSQLQD